MTPYICLFVCSKNRSRSPTAEDVFSAYKDIGAISAGKNSDSETPVSGDLIEWTDIVFVMERTHRNKVSKKFQNLLKGKKLVCLDIKDNYQFMDPELIKTLKIKVAKYVLFN